MMRSLNGRQRVLRRTTSREVVVGGRHWTQGHHTTMFEVRPFFARLAGLPARPGPTQIAAAINAGRVLVRIRLRVEATGARDEAPAAKPATDEGAAAARSV